MAKFLPVQPIPQLQQEIEEFLVATRKYNPRAGDPEVYIRLQAEGKMALLMEGRWKAARSSSSMGYLG